MLVLRYLSDMRRLGLPPAWEIAQMITFGLDPHPGSHTAVSLDNNGASLGI
jgi:hypothetical protein